MTAERSTKPAAGVPAARHVLPVVAGLAAVAADVVGDSAVRTMDRSVEIFGPYLRLAPSTNDGVAFGLLQGTGALPLVLGTVGVVAIIVLARRHAAEPLLQLALGLMIGGAVANLLERLAFGAVLDYLDMGVGTLRWPTYNLADVAISLAALLLIAAALRAGRSVPAPE